jgi:hypothetical protein
VGKHLRGLNRRHVAVRRAAATHLRSSGWAGARMLRACPPTSLCQSHTALALSRLCHLLWGPLSYEGQFIGLGRLAVNCGSLDGEDESNYRWWVETRRRDMEGPLDRSLRGATRYVGHSHKTITSTKPGGAEVEPRCVKPRWNQGGTKVERMVESGKE